MAEKEERPGGGRGDRGKDFYRVHLIRRHRPTTTGEPVHVRDLLPVVLGKLKARGAA